MSYTLLRRSIRSLASGQNFKFPDTENNEFILRRDFPGTTTGNALNTTIVNYGGDDILEVIAETRAAGAGFRRPRVRINSNTQGLDSATSDALILNLQTAGQNDIVALLFENGGDDFGRIGYERVTGNAASLHIQSRQGGVLADRIIYDHTNSLNFQQASTITTTAGDLTLAASQDVVLPSVSQNAQPTLTTDGGYIAWEDADASGGASSAYLVVQINGTPYTFASVETSA